jgi:amino acid/amide ABC transporter substrate-binding protein, HAAT family (TC 3.A.1.4.-)
MKCKHTTLALMLAAAGLATGAANAQEKVVIGYVSDLSSLYSDVEGKGGATAIQMAIDTSAARPWASPSNCSPPTTRTRPTSLRPRRASGLIPRAPP